MKVRIVSYPHVGLGKGGMNIQIKNTIDALKQNRVNVIEHNFMDNEIAEDVLHVFGTHSSSMRLVEHCRKLNVPVIISTVFNRFDVSSTRKKLDKYFMNIPGFLSELSTVKKMLNLADLIIALNDEERELLIYYFGLNKDKIIVIPNGIDEEYLNNSDAKFNIKKNVVLNVASITPIKNQLNLIKASINAPWELRLVGPVGDLEYFRLCQNIANGAKNITFVGSLPYNSVLLQNEYAEAKTFCLPSFSEVQPLSIIEAAAYNCNIVVSNRFPLNKELKSSAFFVNPSDSTTISKQIKKSLETTSQTSSALRNLLLWKEVGEKILKIYESLM